jgi:hypothetical protein
MKELDKVRAAESRRHEPSAPVISLPSLPSPAVAVKEPVPQDINETAVSSASRKPNKRGMQLMSRGHRSVFDD